MNVDSGMHAARARAAKSAGGDGHMWSAVALQQHMTRQLRAEGRLTGLPAPTAQREGTLSLAQKMGLVPAPPPAPSASEWHDVEEKASIRGDLLRPCAICHEPFDFEAKSGAAATGKEQVILNCAHVYHATCLRQFERFARASGHHVRCPVCRHPQYHKRATARGAADVQRRCVVRIQARIRGVLARKRFLAMRLAADPTFRRDYYYRKLRRYADWHTAATAVRAEEVDRFLEDIDAQREKAAAMMLTPAEWCGLRDAARTRFAEPPWLRHAEPANVATITDDGTVVDAADAASSCGDGAACPICFDALEWRTQGAASHSDPVATPAATCPAVAPPRGPAPAAGSVAVAGRRAGAASGGHRAAPAVPPAAPGRRVTMPAKAPTGVAQEKKAPEPPERVPAPAAPVAPRTVVVTSCGHCFHHGCLSAFANFAVASAADASTAVARCPVCRRGYLAEPL